MPPPAVAHVLRTAGRRCRRRGASWFGYVSLPIFQFLLFRWYFRLAIWARFLWQVSRHAAETWRL